MSASRRNNRSSSPRPRSQSHDRTNGEPGRVTRLLARPGDPLILRDGRIVPPVDETPKTVTPQKFKATKRRALNELPAPVGTMNGIACTLMYTLFGISDHDIAEAMKVTVDDVKKLKRHSGYSEAFNIASGEFINANSDLLASRLAAHSHKAITNIVDLADNARKENVKLGANQDILDRAGVTAKENASKASMQKSELRIIQVDGELEVSMTTFNGV